MCLSICVSCVSAWHSWDKHTSYSPRDNAALVEQGREKIVICNASGSDSFDIRLWCELRCSCTVWAMIQRRKAGLASPSHHWASVGMQQGRRTMRLSWAGIHFNQTQLTGWVHQHYKPCLAHNSHNASGQKLPQPLQRWMCSNVLLLKEKTTCSFQSSQLVRNTNRERGKKNQTTT